MRGWKAPAALCGWLLLQGCGGDEPAPAAGGEPAAAGASGAQNSPPVIEELALEPARPRPGQSVNARVVAHDPDGDPISLDYRWRVDGRRVEHADGRSSLHVEGGRESSIEVTVVARDAHGESAPEMAMARVGNLPPTIVQVVMKPLGAVTAGNDVTASPRATDPEGSSIEYSYEWRVNDETVPVDGPTLPATLLKRGDRIELRVVASDGSDESEPLVSPPIEVVNATPKVVSRPGPIGPDGIFRYQVQAEDPDGDHAFRYRLAQGPKGMAIDFDDGQLRWEPPVDAAGKHEVEVEVEDLFGGSAKQRFTLELSYETEQVPAAAARKAAGQAAGPPADADTDAEADTDSEDVDTDAEADAEAEAEVEADADADSDSEF